MPIPLKIQIDEIKNLISIDTITDYTKFSKLSLRKIILNKIIYKKSIPSFFM